MVQNGTENPVDPTDPENPENEEDSENSTSLSTRQRDALPYLVASGSLSEAARLADVGRTTLYRWMNDPDFSKPTERLRKEASELAHSELRGLMLKAILVLAESLEDPNPGIRLRAARATLNVGLKGNDLKELQTRLDKLDDAYALWQSKKGPQIEI